MKEFKLEEVLEKLTIEELVSELVRRNEERELVQISFQYLLKKVGYSDYHVEKICKQLSDGMRYPSFGKASN